MDFDLTTLLFSGDLQNEILATNEESIKYGLQLSESETNMLVQVGKDALLTQERLEFGKSVTPKLIQRFMQSSYISQSEYANTIALLIDIFYEVKDESLDILNDDEVIEIMFNFFENESGGSIELLQGRDMDLLCRKIRNAALGVVEED